jgi:hypothetical protein
MVWLLRLTSGIELSRPTRRSLGSYVNREGKEQGKCRARDEEEREGASHLSSIPLTTR